MWSNHRSRFDLAEEALLQDQRLNEEAKSVYRMLVTLHMRCQAKSWPRPQALAAALGSTPRAVRIALACLADLGYLERVHKPGTGRGRVGYRFPRVDDGLLLSGVIAAKHTQQTHYQHAFRLLPTRPSAQGSNNANPAPTPSDPSRSRLLSAVRSQHEAECSMCTPSSSSALKTRVWQLHGDGHAAHPETRQE